MRALILLSLAACGFPRATAALECQVTDDCDGDRVCIDGFCVVGDDTGPDGPPPDTARFDCTQWPAPQHFMPCDIMQPTGALTLDQPIVYTLDTGAGTVTPAGGQAIPVATEMLGGDRLISVDSLTIATGATLRVIGPAPLIVAAWTTIEIAGDIEAGSTQLEPGAGSNPTTECALRLATPGTANNDGGGGAGGGGFQGTGGPGGRGDLAAALGGPGGAPVTPAPLLLGGCSGAKGGDGDLPGGIGGSGGGAFQLTAKDSITIDGKLNAGGAGGEPGGAIDDGGGGGGGGAGGMIGLEAAMIAINATAIVAANGGGGGEGGRSPGQRGQDATAVATRALGGNNGTGGNGGLGSGQGITNGGQGQNDQNGGGGGGGGGAAGFITLKAASTANAGTVTPAPTIIP